MKRTGTLCVAATGLAIVTALGASAYQRGLTHPATPKATAPAVAASALSASAVHAAPLDKRPGSPMAARRAASTRIRLAQAPAGAQAAGAAGAVPSSPAASSQPAAPIHADSPELAALKAQRQAQRVTALKGFLEAQGLAEAKAQSAVIEQLMAQEQARRALQEAGRKLFPVLGRKGMPPVPEAQATAQIEAYDQAIKAYQEARHQSAQALETQLGYSKSAHLRAVLTVLGLIGDGPAILAL